MFGMTKILCSDGHVRNDMCRKDIFPIRNIYSSRVTRKERNRVGTKFSEGQLFIFRDRQDSCLPSAARLDSPEDQGKGKVGPRKVLFLQEYNFLQG